MENRIRASQKQATDFEKQFEEINDKISVISERIQSINQASKEQIEGIRQTSNAIIKINSASQENIIAAVSSSTQIENLEHECDALDAVTQKLSSFIM